MDTLSFEQLDVDSGKESCYGEDTREFTMERGWRTREKIDTLFDIEDNDDGQGCPAMNEAMLEQWHKHPAYIQMQLRKEADRCIRDQEYEQAEAICKQMLSRNDPFSRYAAGTASRLFFKMGQGAKALQIIDSSLEQYPDSFFLHMIKVNALQKLGCEDEAVFYLLQFFEQPDSKHFRWLIKKLTETNRVHEMLDFCTRFVAHHSNDPWLWMGRICGLAMFATKVHDTELRESFDAMCEALPDAKEIVAHKCLLWGELFSNDLFWDCMFERINREEDLCQNLSLWQTLLRIAKKKHLFEMQIRIFSKIQEAFPDQDVQCEGNSIVPTIAEPEKSVHSQ